MPQLRHKWSEAPPETADERCDYHERYPGDCGGTPAPDQPSLAEVEDDYLVACRRAGAVDVAVR